MFFNKFINLALNKPLMPPAKPAKHKFLTTSSAKKSGFSLAEVLITLSILGIIAAMTIPTTMVNVQEKVAVTKLKKAYALLNQSYQIAILENGPLDEWGLENGHDTVRDEEGNVVTPQSHPSATTYIELILSGSKAEYISNMLDYQISWLNGSNKFTLQGNYRLPDGMVFTLGYVQSNTCSLVTGTSEALKNVCGHIAVDINGPKKPNIMGKDVFLFWVTKTAIVPMGGPGETSRKPEIYCNPSTTNTHNGYGCAGWAIQNGTMPWLHGEYVSWDK